MLLTMFCDWNISCLWNNANIFSDAIYKLVSWLRAFRILDSAWHFLSQYISANKLGVEDKSRLRKKITKVILTFHCSFMNLFFKGQISSWLTRSHIQGHGSHYLAFKWEKNYTHIYVVNLQLDWDRHALIK